MHAARALGKPVKWTDTRSGAYLSDLLLQTFGLAIILLTLLVRGMMFPVAQRQFASMAAMRALQPKMKAIQERYKDDKQRQQQEIMQLYFKYPLTLDSGDGFETRWEPQPVTITLGGHPVPLPPANIVTWLLLRFSLAIPFWKPMYRPDWSAVNLIPTE